MLVSITLICYCPLMIAEKVELDASIDQAVTAAATIESTMAAQVEIHSQCLFLNTRGKKNKLKMLTR